MRILKKREDGYHELTSLFQAVSLHDIMHFTIASRDSLTCTDPTLQCGLDNFVTKAVELFRSKTLIKQHFCIDIEKNIPQQAGLGGGSSNCATTLFALNQLCNTNIPEETLRSWAATISADAPFFFSSGTAYCQGIGEKVESLAPFPWLTSKNIYIFMPNEGLSTRDIFHNLDLSQCKQISPNTLLTRFRGGEPLFHNDLEQIATKLCPTLIEFKKILLQQGFEALFMTGSGTACVALSNSLNITIDNSLNAYLSLPINRNNSDWY